LLERGADILSGASKGNSGILHTGFDAPPDSLELHCIRQGYVAYHAIRERLNLPVLRTGALVIAWTDEELTQLPAILARALENGIPEVDLIVRSALQLHEPHLSATALGAVRIPGESLIDPWSAPLAYARQALAHGAHVRCRAEVRSGVL